MSWQRRGDTCDIATLILAHDESPSYHYTNQASCVDDVD